MATPHLGNGTVMSIVYIASTTTVESTVAIGGILSITGPDAVRDTVDVTQLASTTPWRIYSKADGDPGTISASVIYDNVDDSQTLGVNVALDGSTQVKFKIEYNAPSSQDTETVVGHVVSRGRTIERNGMIVGDITLKISSDVGFQTST